MKTTGVRQLATDESSIAVADVASRSAPAFSALKIAVLSRNPEILGQVQRCLASNDIVLYFQIWPCDANALAAMIEKENPDLVLLEGSNASATVLEALQAVAKRHNHLAVILLSNQPMETFNLGVLRLGATELVPLPISHSGLQHAIKNIRGRHFSAQVTQQRGNIIAWMPCKAGAGATFIAANLAHALADEGKRVCLIDLNLHFGEASLYVTPTRPARTLADVVSQIHRLDRALLESNMLRVSENFWLLAAPDSPSMIIRPEAIAHVLNVARASFDFVLLDVSRSLDANAIQALDSADLIYLVLKQTPPFMRDARRLLKLLSAFSGSAGQINLLVNRYRQVTGIDLRNIEKSLGVAVTQTIPDSLAAVSSSVKQSRPIGDLAPFDAVAKALREMARELAQMQTGDGSGLNWQRARRA